MGEGSRKVTRVGVLGAGGLGKAAALVLEKKTGMVLAAICDRGGVLHSTGGLAGRSGEIAELPVGASVAEVAGGRPSPDAVGEMIELARAGAYEALFIALPNLPNEFIPSVVTRYMDAGVPMAYVDALKRTRAAELMFGLDERMKRSGGTYLTGCGATPGLLTAAAVVAAQSFARVESVKIWWGVGISNWEAYRATVREDIAHLPGFTLERAKAMTDAEVEHLLAERDGKLVLKEMEHADDLMLERAGVVESRDQVEVGGVLDTRSAKKPVTTTMTLTGVTFEGKRSQHTFRLGDETSMAANVVGPAMGYLKRALWLQDRGIHGVFGSTEQMPMIAA